MKQFAIIIFIIFSLSSIAQHANPGIRFQDNNKISATNNKALNFYTEQIEKDPLNVHALVLRSKLNRSLGNFDQSESDMAMAMLINPYAKIYDSQDSRLEVFPVKSYAYMISDENKNTDFEKSHLLNHQYDEFLQLSDLDNPEIALLQTALKYAMDDQFNDASKTLELLKPETKTFALYYDIKGILELEAGEFQKAVEYFTLSIEDNPYFVIPYYNRAVAYKSLGMFDKSEDDFYSALNLNAEIAQIHFSKGKLFELKKDFKGAEYYYKNALEINNNYSEAATNYSVLLKTSGEYGHAMTAIEKAIKQNPDNLKNYYVKGGLNFIYGEYEKAVNDFDRYLSGNENDNDALFFRGLNKILINNSDDGCNDLLQSIENGYDSRNIEMVFYLCN